MKQLSASKNSVSKQTRLPSTDRIEAVANVYGQGWVTLEAFVEACCKAKGSDPNVTAAQLSEHRQFVTGIWYRWAAIKPRDWWSNRHRHM